MNVFILKNGERIETERFVQGPKLSPGCWWWSTGQKEYEERPIPYVSPYLFGHVPEDLLAKQYK